MAERLQHAQLLEENAVQLAEEYLSADIQLGLHGLDAENTLDCLVELLAEVQQLILRQGEAGRHGVPAETQEGVLAFAEQIDQIEAADASGGACVLSAWVACQHDGWAVVAAGQAACHDADDALVPVIGPDDERADGFEVAALGNLLLGGLHDCLLNGLAFAVLLVKDVGELRRADHAGGFQQLKAVGRVTHTPCCVDSRGKPVGDVRGGEDVVDARDFAEGVDARAALLRQDAQTMLDEDAVFVEERHDVRHCAKRD